MILQLFYLITLNYRSYLGGNSLQTEGAIKIARGLQNTSTLTILDISNNNIGVEAADDIATVLSHNTKLQS